MERMLNGDEEGVAFWRGLEVECQSKNKEQMSIIATQNDLASSESTKIVEEKAAALRA